MSPEMVDALRSLNAASSLAVLLFTLRSSVSRWSELQPSQRLFTLAFGLYIVHAVAISVIGILDHLPPNVATAILPIANIWMLGALVSLQREHKRGRARHPRRRRDDWV